MQPTQPDARTHTPGPWTIVQDNPFILGPNALVLAHFYPVGSDGTGDANGRLIAAAPDMLKMLEEASYAFSERLEALEEEREWRAADEVSDMIGHYGVLKSETDAVIAKVKTGK